MGMSVWEQDWQWEIVLPMRCAFCRERALSFQRLRRMPRIMLPLTAEQTVMTAQVGLELEAACMLYLTRMVGPVSWDIHDHEDVTGQVDIEGWIGVKCASKVHFRLAIQKTDLEEGAAGKIAYVHGLSHMRPKEALPKEPWKAALAGFCWAEEGKKFGSWEDVRGQNDWAYYVEPSAPFFKPMEELAAELKRRGTTISRMKAEGMKRAVP
jgi:hypothetical protein